MYCDTHKTEIYTKNRGSIEDRVVNWRVWDKEAYKSKGNAGTARGTDA